MRLRDTVYKGIIAGLPPGTEDQKGYFELVDIWEGLDADTNAGRDFSLRSFEELIVATRTWMTPREQAFFGEPFPDDITSHNALLQALVIKRLTKILMDRHGFKVSKEDGGLGV